MKLPHDSKKVPLFSMNLPSPVLSKHFAKKDRSCLRISSRVVAKFAPSTGFMTRYCRAPKTPALSCTCFDVFPVARAPQMVLLPRTLFTFVASSFSCSMP